VTAVLSGEMAVAEARVQEQVVLVRTGEEAEETAWVTGVLAAEAHLAAQVPSAAAAGSAGAVPGRAAPADLAAWEAEGLVVAAGGDEWAMIRRKV
jgi:hypothetical protein